MRRTICCIITLLLFFQISAFAETNQILTLEKAVDKAIDEDKQLSIEQYSYEVLQETYSEASDDAKLINMEDVEDEYLGGANPDYETVISKREDKYLVPRQKKSDMVLNILSKRLRKSKIENNVYDSYYSLVKAIQEQELKQKKYNLKQKQYSDMKLKYDKGMVSKKEYTISEYEKDNAKTEMLVAKRQKEKAIGELNKLLNNDFDKDVNIEEKFDYKDLSNINIETTIEKAIENRFEISKLREKVALKQTQLNIVDVYYDEDHAKYKEADLNLQEAKLNLESKKIDIEHELRIGYNKLLNMLDTIKINKKEMLKKEIKYFIAKLKYNLEMITKLELDKEKFALEKAKVNLNNSIADYIIEYQKFTNAQDIGPAFENNIGMTN